MSLKVDISNIFSRYRLIKEQNEVDMLQNKVSKTTTGEEHNLNSISKETFEQFENKIIAAKKYLQKTKPFYFFVLNRLRTVPTLSIPTMAVDDNHNIYMNPNFTLNDMNLQETSGVLAHEASHVYRRDFARVKSRDRQIWNVASDYIINMNLTKDGHKLPKGGLIPKKIRDNWFIDESNAFGTLKVDITDISTEELYDILLKKYKSDSEKLKELIDELIEKQEEFDEHIEEGGGQSQPGEGQPGQPGRGSGGIPIPVDIEGMDPGDVPGSFKPDPKGGTDAEKEAKAKNITQGALKDADDLRKRGTDPGTPGELEIERKIATVDWHSILRTYLKKGSKSYYNIKRPNKRALAAGYYAPKMEQVYNKLDAVITLDTSGSISDGMINTFVSEVIAIIKAAPHVRALIIFWETYAYSPRKDGRPFIIEGSKQSIDDAQKQLSNLKVSRGGTYLSSITKYYNENKKFIPNFKPAVLITFTDGMIESDPVLPADIPFNNRVFLINNFNIKSAQSAVGDDSIVKRVGKHVYGVKVEG